MELRHGLSQLGLTNVADVDVRRALAEAYPDGYVGVESSELLGVVFTEFSQDQDNG